MSRDASGLTPTVIPVGKFIAPIPGSGLGTYERPYGLADLQIYNPSPGDPSRVRYTSGAAFAGLQPGETLYFRGGDYHLQSGTTANALCYNWGMIGPLRSGVFGAPITVRSYPGETVNLIVDTYDANQPVFGGPSYAFDYIRFQGFYIYVSDATTGNTQNACFNIYGSYNEISYNECVARYLNSGDNHQAIYINGDPGSIPCTGNWIHHNNIHGATGPWGIDNSAGIKVYKNGTLLVEDNYIHDNNCGVYDKDSGRATLTPPFTHQSIYRRNYFANNSNFGVVFPGQDFYICAQATIKFYDNFLDNWINVQRWQTGTQIYNNLISIPASNTANQNDYNHSYPNKAIEIMDNTFQTELWSNVVFTPSNGPITAIEYVYGDFVSPGDPSAAISYLDCNVYTGTPTYDFGYYGYQSSWPPGTSQHNNALLSHKTLSDMRVGGLEQNSSVVASPLDVYQDLVNYVLKPQWQTAGRNGEPVGPRVQIGGTGGILDTSRYGPAALP